MARSFSLAPAAVGLVLANVVGIVAVIGSCLMATRAAEARDRALAALAEARAGRVQAAEAAIRASAPRPRTKRLDRMLLLGALGVVGSALCTWRIVSGTGRERIVRPRAGARATFRTRRRPAVDLPHSRPWW
jgi:hypothetical protein